MSELDDLLASLRDLQRRLVLKLADSHIPEGQIEIGLCRLLSDVESAMTAVRAVRDE